MHPYYTEPGITIYHGDCREVLPHIAPGSINLVLTDPPYGVGFHYGTSYQDTPNGYIDWIWQVMLLAEQVLEHGYMAVFQSAKYARAWAQWFPREWELIALPKVFGQWYKSQRIQKRTDYVLYWLVGHGLSSDTRGHRQVSRDWFVSRETAATHYRPDHPCPRALDAMLFLVELLSDSQGTILDLFMGSGTTLLASKELGRHAIGVDIDEYSCEIAVNRLRQGVLPLVLEA